MSDLVSFEPIDQTSSWVENLALDELNMEESGVVNFQEHLDPMYHLEESSLSFMEILKDRFEFFTHRFNQFRGGKNQGAHIKIFKISNTVNDFMLYRNSLKLVVSRKANDLISIGFVSNTGGLFSARLNLNTPAIASAHEIKAHVGPFNDISWRYQGDEVNPDALVKHYLSEFIRHSAY